MWDTYCSRDDKRSSFSTLPDVYISVGLSVWGHFLGAWQSQTLQNAASKFGVVEIKMTNACKNRLGPSKGTARHTSTHFMPLIHIPFNTHMKLYRYGLGSVWVVQIKKELKSRVPGIRSVLFTFFTHIYILQPKIHHSMSHNVTIKHLHVIKMVVVNKWLNETKVVGDIKDRRSEQSHPFNSPTRMTFVTNHSNSNFTTCRSIYTKRV